jgi:hypothetical protein
MQIQQLEAFISDIEAHVISPVALDEDNNKHEPSAREKEIRVITAQVSDQDHIILPADTTICFSIMQTDEHNKKCSETFSRTEKKF